MKYSTDMDQFNRMYSGEEFKELTNPGHEVKHDLDCSVDSSWYFHPGMVLCIVILMEIHYGS